MAQSDPDIQRGLEILKLLKPAAQPAPQAQAQDPDIQRGLEILKLIKPQQPEQPQEMSYGDRAAQLGRGVASGTASMADALSMYGGQMGRLHDQDYANATGDFSVLENPEEKYKILDNPKVEKTVTSGIDKAYGRDLTPKDTAGRFLNTTGQLLSPMPGDKIKKVGNAVLQGGKLAVRGAKAIAKHVGRVVGASAAINAPGHLTEEGGVGRVAEDLGRAVVGSKIGHAAVTPIQSIKKGSGNLAARAMSLGTNPEKEVLSLAEKHGIELPHNVGTGTGMGARAQNFLANNYLSKNIFASGKYKKAYQKADDAMMGKVRESVSELGDSTLKPSEASGEFKHFAKGEESRAQKTAEKLYDKSKTFLTEADKIVPANTEKAISELEKILDTPIRGADNKSVTKHLAELGENWGIFKEGDLAKWESKGYSRDNLKEIFSKLKISAKEIPTEEYVKATQGINAIIGSKDTPGVKNLLKGLRGAIVKDLETSTNKEFLAAHKEANDFFKENIAQRFRTKKARSVLRDEGAVEAYSHLNSVEGIKKLEKMAGTSQEGTAKLNALKKQKAIEILESTIEGNMENGSLRKGAFSKLFEKGSKKQEVLERLLGQKQYDNLSEIAKISESFSAHGKDLLNTSHTAITTANITQGSAVGSTVIHAIFGTVPPAQIVAAAGVMGTPYFMSRIMSNPNIVSQARIYALARQKGNDKYAAGIMKNLVKMVGKEANAIKTVGVNATTKSKEGDKDNVD